MIFDRSEDVIADGALGQRITGSQGGMRTCFERRRLPRGNGREPPDEETDGAQSECYGLRMQSYGHLGEFRHDLTS